MNNKNPPSKHHKNESDEELLARSVDFLEEKAMLDPTCASLSRHAMSDESNAEVRLLGPLLTLIQARIL